MPRKKMANVLESAEHEMQTIKAAAIKTVTLPKLKFLEHAEYDYRFDLPPPLLTIQQVKNNNQKKGK